MVNPPKINDSSSPLGSVIAIFQGDLSGFCPYTNMLPPTEITAPSTSFSSKISFDISQPIPFPTAPKSILNPSGITAPSSFTSKFLYPT